VTATESAPDDSSSLGSAWTAGQVAQYLGISESTLRTWHRRYGLDPDGAQPGRYRRYRQADIARLRRMRDLIAAGMLSSEAARVVQSGEPGRIPPAQDVADLIAAARSLDTDRCRLLLDGVLARHGAADAWELVCRPALVAVDAHQQDPYCVDVEHTLSWVLVTALGGVPRPPAGRSAASTMLACTDGELHTLPLAALAAALVERRVPVRMLGASTPTPSLVRAVREIRPATVVLWAQRPETADREVLRDLAGYPVRVVTAGPGWPPQPPPGVRHVETLTQAVTLLA
jgi:MerR family transcriptional regulator, light-induced transcriptional regulator